MKVFNVFKKKESLITIEDIKQENYKQRYFELCKFIWKNYVPKNGQSNTLQGELLRQLEKLRCEAQDNGNRNWDDDYIYFCDFIKGSLCNQSVFDKFQKRRITVILDYIKECGCYSYEFNEGRISKDSVKIDKMAYIEDDLYDIVADAIGFLQLMHPEPIPFIVDNRVKR